MSTKPLDLTKIVKQKFPDHQYYKVAGIKKQIVLHHTASGRGIDGDFTHWMNEPNRIATCVIIASDGTINQLFESRYWGHHLGVTTEVFLKHGIARTESNNTILNQESIAIEIDSWGPLALFDGGYRSYTGALVPFSEVQAYEKPFKNLPSSTFFDKIGVSNTPARFYQKYTTEQLESTRQLLEYWCKTYGIPNNYDAKMWDVSTAALRGMPGIWAHVSYRKDKADVHPQPELIQMLQSLKP